MINFYIGQGVIEDGVFFAKKNDKEVKVVMLQMKNRA